MRQTLKDVHLMLDQARKAGQKLPLLEVHAAGAGSLHPPRRRRRRQQHHHRGNPPPPVVKRRRILPPANRLRRSAKIAPLPPASSRRQNLGAKFVRTKIQRPPRRLPPRHRPRPLHRRCEHRRASDGLFSTQRSRARQDRPHRPGKGARRARRIRHSDRRRRRRCRLEGLAGHGVLQRRRRLLAARASALCACA